MKDPLFIIVDLFCGAGGTTTGFVQAELEDEGIAKVIACVNHDAKAIKSHWWNHPDVKHFEEDIRTLDLTELKRLVEYYRDKYPNAYLILWASLECTNFSKAKGGQPRDADSRTLADHLDRYVIALKPDYVQIENVVEFRSWGPLDEHGKPVSKKNGQDWMRWRELICCHGYVDEWKELNSANYGAYTSRNRLFGIFARPGLPIVWPEPTHAKNPSKFSMHGDLQKWMAVKEKLDFNDEGKSIFTRKKTLVDNTLERIYAGLLKFVAKGDTSFISKYYSGKPKGKVNSVNQPASTVTTFGGQALVQAVGFTAQSIDQPAGALTTIDHHALVQSNFLVKYNSKQKDGSYSAPSVEDPAPVITTQNRLYLAQLKFITNYYSSGGELTSVENPSPTISTRDRSAVVSVTGNNIQSVDQPAGTIMTNDKHSVVTCDPFIMPTNYDNKPVSTDQPAPTITANRKHHYLVNPSHGGNCSSTDQPCPVIVARQDKVPLYLVQAEPGSVAVPVYEGESEVMIRIKKFMAVFNIVDIKMRMLRVHELLRIQGFPDSYKLEGNQEDQKKFIGNSVVPLVVQKWTEALGARVVETYNQKIA
jgi:DNA (cytosine-5)-methyltransferase 1